MKTVLVTGPSATPVALVEMKAHCIVTHNEDDDYLTALINVAVSHIEEKTGRKLMEQTWKVLFDTWPDAAELPLPFGNCLSVAAITYKDPAGTVTPWDSGEYVVDTDSVPGRVVIGYDKAWPTAALFHVNPVVITAKFGYGTVAKDVPAPLSHAIKLLVGHWYENREIVVTGSTIAKIPVTVDALIWPYRLFGF